VAVDKKELWEYIPQKERDSIPLEDFAWPEERKYPCDTQDHVDSCAKLLGHAPADKQASIKARAIRIAKRHGFSIPDSWKNDGTSEESDGRPAKKIGTLPICWLEYGARSLNGRIYPKPTCDAIFRAAQDKLARPQDFAHPPTTFVSHEDANGNVNTHLVGGPTKVWQEGNKFWANIDLADTTVAHDMLGLAEGGYLKSGSMRVMGVELRHDRSYDLPLVVVQEGAEPEFMGIDLTTKPGLANVARIPYVIYESDGHESYIDAFPLNDVLIEAKEEAPMSHIPLWVQSVLDAGIPGSRRYPLQEGMTPDRKAHQRIHDHLAGVMDAAIAAKHGNESARYISLVEAELSEEGKAIAQKHAIHLAAAHDESARQLGMDCEGAYNEALGLALDPDRDGDDGQQSNQDTGDEEDDGESHQGEKELTEQEMIDALKAKGYTIPEKKTKEQELQEAFDAKLAEQERKFNEKLAALTESTPQRKTQAASSLSETTNNELAEEDLYHDGDYLAGKLHPKNWKALANPKVPWPQDVDPELALHELAPLIVHRMLATEADARGIEISTLVGPYDQL
jgi:hypothetical protein